MGWLPCISISILTGALGLVCGGVIMSACVSWYRVSSFEGKSGYAVIAVALLGGVGGLVVGLVAARIVAAGASPGFLKGLGVAWGAALAISLAALAICRLCADLAPTMDGDELELDIEVRCPRGFQVPPSDPYGATAGIYLPRGRRQPAAPLRLDEAKTVDEQRIVPATVPLTTSSARKFLRVRFSKDHDLLFHLPLRSRPNETDSEWSRWVESGWDAGKPEPPRAEKFHARYRVQKIEAPTPEPQPDPEEVRAKAFAALEPDAPLEAWLPFLFDSPTDQRTRAVIQRIEERQAELSRLVRSTDDAVREQALRATAYPSKPAPEVTEAVLAEGRDIAAGIREFNKMQADDPRYHEVLLDLRSRFNCWKQAWWVLSQRLGVDGRPPIREIHDLATVRARGTAMDEIEINARVILEALDKAAADER